jgi:hypothetical protein
MQKRTYSLIGAIALAWSGAGVAADTAKGDATPLDPARVQAGGSGESGISGDQGAGAVKEGEEVRASQDTASREDPHAKDEAAGDGSGQGKAEAGKSQGEAGVSSSTNR